MIDPYPTTLDIEIDRDRLRNYLRVKWLLAWVIPLSLMGGFFAFLTLPQILEHGAHSWGEIVFAIVRSVGTGFGIGFILALLLYLLLSHRTASRLASSLHVTVEGAFLRVRQHTSFVHDRKLHFRAIVDYATLQSSLMRRFGIHALQMSTIAGGQNTNVIIFGVKDCLHIRDVLADIDRLRENQ